MNKKQALELMIEHWNCLAETMATHKTSHFPQAQEWDNACVLCEYDTKHNEKFCDEKCLVEWKSPRGCLGKETPYRAWGLAIAGKERRKYAIEVATLAERALDRLERRRKRT